MTGIDRSHIVPLPKWILIPRISQLVTAVVIFGIACYGVSVSSFDGDSLILFTALSTIIIVCYIIGAELFWPLVYNYWAILGLEIFAVLFWLISFALLASEVNAADGDNCIGCYSDIIPWPKKRSVGNTFNNSMAAASGLGGLQFALFIITLVVFSLNLHSHRKSGAHCMPAQAAARWSANPHGTGQGREMQHHAQPLTTLDSQPVGYHHQPAGYGSQLGGHQPQPAPYDPHLGSYDPRIVAYFPQAPYPQSQQILQQDNGTRPTTGEYVIST